MDREQARYYIDRWEMVRAVERRELRRMSMKRRFEQTAAMFAAGVSFPKDDVFAQQRAEEIERVRRTWEKLKRGKT
jgi:hypothetical protein